MRADRLMDAVGGIGDGYVEKYAFTGAKEEGRSVRVTLRARLVIAACIALITVFGVGTYVYAEGAEYQSARAFFEENGLSADGLTRAEIKAVYRDITTESFTYGRTAEVIGHSLGTERVSGFAFSGDWNELDQATVKALWEAYDQRRNSEGVRYYTSLILVHHDEGGGWNEETGSYLEKYDGMTLVWKAEFDGLFIQDHLECGDGLFIYANEFDGNLNRLTWLIRLNGSGETVWKKRYGDIGENVHEALIEDDGSFTLLSHRADANGYCFGRVDADGRLIFREKYELSGQVLNKAVHYRGGYLVRLVDFNRLGEAGFVIMNSRGEIGERFSYSSEDEFWFARDMIEYEGKIYLSVTAMPKEGSSDETDVLVNARRCMKPAVMYAFENWLYSEDAPYPYEVEGLTEKVRERCRAMLLVLEPDGGEPKTFYSADGGLGGGLSVSEGGGLVWNVENIVGTYFSPATNSFTVAGSCRVVRYSFTPDGSFAGCAETDEITTARW